MKFINASTSQFYNSFVGKVNPGKCTNENRSLEDLLRRIVRVCGDRILIRLNKTELELLEKVSKLHESGTAFKPDSIPAEIRDDPEGVQRARRAAAEAQHAETERNARKNVESARREAVINGEIDENAAGASSGSSVRKSGFDIIMEQNAKLEQERREKGYHPVPDLRKGAQDADPDGPANEEAKEPAVAAEAPADADTGTNEAPAEETAESVTETDALAPEETRKGKGKRGKGKKSDKVDAEA